MEELHEENEEEEVLPTSTADVISRFRRLQDFARSKAANSSEDVRLCLNSSHK